MMPLQHVLQSSTVLEAHALNAREFTTRAPKSLGPNSLVVLCSHSGDTPETVEAARFAREQGALTIALTHELESPLALASEFVIGYQHGDAKRYAYTSAPILYRIIHALVDRATSSSTLAPATDAVAALDGIVEGLLAAHYDRADAWAKAHARSGLIYACDPTQLRQRTRSRSSFQEMLGAQPGHQQRQYSTVPSRSPTSTCSMTSSVLGSRVRSTSARVPRHESDDVLTLDAAEWDLALVPEAPCPSSRTGVHPAATALCRTSCRHRGHPSVRRYMWRMEY